MSKGGKVTLGLRQPLKWPGGKHYLADDIIALFPQHIHYVEPFAGGLAVLLARDPMDFRLWVPGHKGVSELVNDINADLVNFWRVLRDDATFATFARRAQAIPMSRREWEDAGVVLRDGAGTDSVDRAVAFFVRCRLSRAGGMKGFTDVTRNRTRRGMNGNVSEWLGVVDGLADVHARLRRVLIENMDGIQLIAKEDTPNTLFYVDAPYVHDTRASTDLYRFEMADEDHVRLVATLAKIQGKAIVSMYRHPIYDALHERHGWRLKEIRKSNHLAGGKSKRIMIEGLWMNY